MTEKRIENHGITAVEAGAWIAAGAGAVVWFIAWIVLTSESSTSIDPDLTAPLAWMSLAQWVAGVAVVPAILLSGIRMLLPDNRIG